MSGGRPALRLFSVQYEVAERPRRPAPSTKRPPKPSCVWPASRKHHAEGTAAPEGQLALRRHLRGLPRGEAWVTCRTAEDRARQPPRSPRPPSTSTVEILRKQRRTFGPAPGSRRCAVETRSRDDRLRRQDRRRALRRRQGAQAFQFIIGEGQMLEQFDQAVRGMKVGESKTFPLQFPADYQGQDVAGKEADFLVTVKKDRSSRTCRRWTRPSRRALGIKEGTRRWPARRRQEEPGAQRSSSACWHATRAP